LFANESDVLADVGFLNAADDVGRADDDPGFLVLEKFGQGAHGRHSKFKDPPLYAVAAHLVELVGEVRGDVFEFRPRQSGNVEAGGGLVPGQAIGEIPGGAAEKSSSGGRQFDLRHGCTKHRCQLWLSVHTIPPTRLEANCVDKFFGIASSELATVPFLILEVVP
jgi:hypothetical protein